VKHAGNRQRLACFATKKSTYASTPTQSLKRNTEQGVAVDFQNNAKTARMAD
jgi:hypothetical protein